jgi:hypothetical protein
MAARRPPPRSARDDAPEPGPISWSEPEAQLLGRLPAVLGVVVAVLALYFGVFGTVARVARLARNAHRAAVASGPGAYRGVVEAGATGPQAPVLTLTHVYRWEGDDPPERVTLCSFVDAAPWRLRTAEGRSLLVDFDVAGVVVEPAPPPSREENTVSVGLAEGPLREPAVADMLARCRGLDGHRAAGYRQTELRPGAVVTVQGCRAGDAIHRCGDGFDGLTALAHRGALDARLEYDGFWGFEIGMFFLSLIGLGAGAVLWFAWLPRAPRPARTNTRDPDDAFP